MRLARLAIVAAVVVFVTACGGRRYHGTAGARLVRFEIRSRLVCSMVAAPILNSL